MRLLPSWATVVALTRDHDKVMLFSSRVKIRWLISGVLIVSPVCFSDVAKGVLLRNVLMTDQNSTAEATTVSILIKDGILDLITEDLVPIDQAAVVYDAAGGVVFGQLELGEPAGFMILAGDPRTNIDYLLDTKRYATFAVVRGKVVKNTFVSIIEETPEEKKRVSEGWLAYAPPPLAVPLNYRDKSRWNRFSGKNVSGIFAAALVLDRQRWTDQDSDSRAQVGDLSASDGGEIRGLRLGGVGTINFDRPWVWTLFAATHAFDKGFDTDESDDLTIFDARLDIPFTEYTSISIGKQKEPISMERIMSMVNLPMQERSAPADALLPSRNTGIVAAGSMFSDRVSLAGGIFNNWLDKDQPSSISDNATQYVGRATWVPYMSENESTLLHLGVGFRYSNAREGGVTGTEPEFNMSPNFVETGFFTADSISTYETEASLRSGPFWLHGEYYHTEIDSPEFNDPTASGYHVTASWILSGGVREYNKRVGIFGRVPIARTVEQNGWGAWEVGTRFSHVDLSELPDLNGGDAGEMDIWSVGLNWWLSPVFNVNLNWRYITLDRNGLEGTSQGFNTRVLLVLE